MTFHVPMNMLELAAGMPDSQMHARVNIECFARTSDLQQVFPYISLPGCTYEASYIACLPEFNPWRFMNQKASGDWGTEDTFMEDMKQMQFMLEADFAILDCPGEDVKFAHQWDMHMTSLGQQWLDNFIWGKRADKACPVGLAERLGPASSIYELGQYTDRHFANNFDPLTSTFVPGGLPLSLAVLQAAVDNTAVGSGKAYWLMNRRMKSQIRSQLYDKDLGMDAGVQSLEDGKPDDLMLCGIPILTGYEKTYNSEFLPFTEEPMGGNGASGLPETSSIYLVVLGENGVHGIMNKPPRIITSGAQMDDCHIWERQSYFHRYGFVVHKMAAMRISGIRLGAITK